MMDKQNKSWRQIFNLEDKFWNLKTNPSVRAILLALTGGIGRYAVTDIRVYANINMNTNINISITINSEVMLVKTEHRYEHWCVPVCVCTSVCCCVAVVMAASNLKSSFYSRLSYCIKPFCGFYLLPQEASHYRKQVLNVKSKELKR